MAKRHLYFEINVIVLMPYSSQFRRLFKTLTSLYLTVMLNFLSCDAVYAEVSLSKEQKLKAAYLLNFTKFIEWPDGIEKKSPSTIRICVDASSDFLQFFSQMVAERRVGKFQDKVIVTALYTASTCELLYIQGLKSPEVDQVNSTIIVADLDNAFPSAAILFYTENRKLRFEIDLKKIKTLKVNVSSELLKLARIK